MDKIFGILKDMGYTVSDDLKKYYNKINIWRYYWKGYDPNFHKYTTTNVRKQPLKLVRKSLNMGKKVAEDWASLLLNDKTYIMIDDEVTQKIITSDNVEQHGGVLGDSKFWKHGNRSVEKAFALGTSVMYIDLNKPYVDNGQLKASNVIIKYIKDPKQFIPLGWDNNEITECALYSYKAIKGKQYIYFQTIIQIREGYKISNFYYEKSGNKYVKTNLPDDMVEWYILPCRPFFVLTPNIENNYIDDVPMGVSCYANAIDCLQLCDVSFDNLYNDFYLGRKKVFMDQDLFATEKITVKDSSGKSKTIEVPLANETLEQSLYVSVGKNIPGEKKMLEEYNPSIRVTENKEGIQFALDLLSSKVGFGQNKYQFQMQSMATATQVRVSNKDQTESIWKQRIQINDFLVEMVQNIIVIQKEVCDLPVKTDAKISVKFDDTMFTDEEAERMKDLNDVNAGIMAKWEYRVKWYGESKKEAKKSISDISYSSPKNSMFGDDE